jgi:hypothetical protein
MTRMLLAAALLAMAVGVSFSYASDSVPNTPENQAYACAILDFVEAVTGNKQVGIENCNNIPPGIARASPGNGQNASA